MDLRRLRTFVTVVEEGSVSKAAVRLRVAQPALSRQIHDLQHELGIRLFDRVGRRLVLTFEGEQLVAHCRALLGYARSLGERAQLLRHGDSGALKVAASPVQMEAVLSTFMPRYAKRYPKVQVKLIEAVVPDIAVMLERGEIDLGIVLEGMLGQDFQFASHPVPPVDLVAVCERSLQLARGNTVEMSRLAGRPLLLLDPSFALRRTFDAACRLARFKPDILIESRVPSNLLAFAEAGHGIAIIQSIVPTHRYQVMAFRLTHDGKPIREPLVIAWDKRRALPRFAQDFCELLAHHMSELFPTADPASSKIGMQRGKKRP